ncbi:MAG: glycosyl hydrolase 53 family protein [Clostridiales bacterium]|nr:glycosyl hydrolase 53 family protein [Clostridiales bacterium]
MKLGIDVSTYYEEIDRGATYYDGDKKVEPLGMLRDNGVDIMRIRVWVNPYDEEGNPYLGGTCDLDNFIRLAKKAESMGFAVMLDIHYSDFWCDPGKQTIPKAWKDLDLSGLTQKVYEYTKHVLSVAEGNGIDIKYIQVGNEITNGMLWPIGKLIEHDKGPRTNYESLIALLKAGIMACREVKPSAALILHLEKSYDIQLYNEFFSNMQGLDYDIIGFSYYPYWHGTFEQFYANVENCKKFGKRLMVVEIGYGFTLEDYIKSSHGGAHLVIDATVVEGMGFVNDYPLTPAGQAKFIRDFLPLARKHGIEAVIWWEPLWIPGDGICWSSENAQRYTGAEEIKSTRNEWANQCLFDYEGKKLPAFDEFVLKG